MALALLHVLLALEAVGDVREHGGELFLEGGEVAPPQTSCHVHQPRLPACFCMEIVRNQQGGHAAPHLLVGKVQPIGVEFHIVVLDGQVSALVNHRQGLFDGGLVVDEVRRRIVAAGHLVDAFVVVLHQPDQIGGRARGEPIVVQTL